MASYLLDRGASLHVRDAFGRTPLVDAVERKHVEIVKLFRKAGAHLAAHIPSGSASDAGISSTAIQRKSSASEATGATSMFGAQICLAVWNRDLQLVR